MPYFEKYSVGFTCDNPSNSGGCFDTTFVETDSLNTARLQKISEGWDIDLNEDKVLCPNCKALEVNKDNE